MSSLLNYQADFFLHHLVTDAKYDDRVRAHWHTHLTPVWSSDHAARQLLHLVMEQIRLDDYQVQHDYTFPVEAISLPHELASAPQQAKAAVRLLMNVIFYYEEPENELYIPRRLLDTICRDYTYVRGSAVNVKFNPAIHNYIRNVAQLHDLDMSPAALPPPGPQEPR